MVAQIPKDGYTSVVSTYSQFPVVGDPLTVYIAEDTGVKYEWSNGAYHALARLSTDANGNTVLVGAGGTEFSTLGSEVITVGAGGRFVTVADALAYIATQSSTITTYQATGSVALEQYSDNGVFTGGDPHLEIQVNDWLYVPDDAQVLGYPDHYYRVLGVFGEEGAGSGERIVLETGICTFTGSIATPTFVRLKPYVLLLSPGEHSIMNGTERIEANRVIIPDGYNISFVGMGPETILTGIPMETPAWGLISFKNLRCTGGTMCGYAKNIFPLLGANYPTVYLEDIRYGASYINDADPSNQNEFLMGVNCAGLYINNFINEHTHDHGVVLAADSLVVNGFQAMAYETGFEPIQLTSLLNRPSGTKPKILNNVSICRRDGTGTSTGDVGAMLCTISIIDGAVNAWEAYFNGLLIVDGSTHGPCIKVTGGTSPAKIVINNSLLENSSYGTEIVSSGAGVVFEMSNTARTDGSNIRTTLTNSVVNNHHPNATKSQAYGATITPNANIAQTWIIGVLTGNPTIAAPTSPALGQTLTLMFAQDATGGRTITWNAVFKKAADGAGAASTKGATTFRYDGTHWVQVSGALTFG